MSDQPEQQEEVEVPISELPKFEFSSIFVRNIINLVLEIINSNQMQNGLRQENYQRYRTYCTHRLDRLRHLLHLNVRQHKNKPFTKTEITPRLISDKRYFLIPLVNCERAWSYAMELKQQQV